METDKEVTPGGSRSTSPIPREGGLEPIAKVRHYKAHKDNECFMFIQRFNIWLTRQFPKYKLRKLKSSYDSINRTNCTLTDQGRKKNTEPCKVWISFKRLSERLVRFDIVEVARHSYISFVADSNNFPESMSLHNPDFENHVLEYIKTSYPHEVIFVKGNSILEDPDPTGLYDNAEMTKNLSNIDLENIEKRVHEGSSIRLHKFDSIQELLANEPTALPGSLSNDTKNGISRTFSELDGFDSTKVLKREIQGANAEIFLLKLENEYLTKQVHNSSILGEGKFNITDYSIRKFLSKSLNGRIYGLEHVNGNYKFSLKDISLESSYPSPKRSFCLSTELKTLQELATKPDKSLHLLNLVDIVVESNIVRKTYLIILEPAAFSLDEFLYSFYKSSSIKVVPVITAQILTGLLFLSDNTSRIHGNLSFENIFIDFKGVVRLANFDFSFHLNSVVPASKLLTATSQDILLKHPYLLEQSTLEADVAVSSNIDLWSLGCIIYKLINGIDLFHSTSTYKDHEEIVASIEDQPFSSFLKAFLVDYRKQVGLSVLLSNEFFQGYTNDSIMNYITQQQ